MNFDYYYSVKGWCIWDGWCNTSSNFNASSCHELMIHWKMKSMIQYDWTGQSLDAAKNRHCEQSVDCITSTGMIILERGYERETYIKLANLSVRSIVFQSIWQLGPSPRPPLCSVSERDPYFSHQQPLPDTWSTRVSVAPFDKLLKWQKFYLVCLW